MPPENRERFAPAGAQPPEPPVRATDSHEAALSPAAARPPIDVMTEAAGPPRLEPTLAKGAQLLPSYLVFWAAFVGCFLLAYPPRTPEYAAFEELVRTLWFILSGGVFWTVFLANSLMAVAISLALNTAATMAGRALLGENPFTRGCGLIALAALGLGAALKLTPPLAAAISDSSTWQLALCATAGVFLHTLYQPPVRARLLRLWSEERERRGFVAPAVVDVD